MNRGFSLIQLSLILTTVALVAGALLFGKSMWRTFELHSIGNDKEHYIAAVEQFRQKYSALPGDIKNAEEIWGTADTRDCLYTPSTDQKTCNGNGNGHIDTGDSSNEYFRFWQHLSNAGLVGGDYSGAPTRLNLPFTALAGTNVPKSRVKNASWFAWDAGRASSERNRFNGTYGNSLMLGAIVGSGLPHYPVLTGAEAADIDTKFDDGYPATGTIVPTIRAACTKNAQGKPLMFDTAEASLIDAAYSVDYDRITCGLYFRAAF